MSRPKKDGLDYFPLDTDFFDDDKVLLLSASGGAEAVLVYIKLLCQIYHSEAGLYYRWDDARAQLLAARLPMRMSAPMVQAAVGACLSVGLFDAHLYAQEGLLTSRGIQRRYIAAISSRLRRRLSRGVDVSFAARNMLLTAEEIKILLGYDADNPPAGNVIMVQKDENPVVCHEQMPMHEQVCHESMPQRKEKERKENKRKEERKENSTGVPSDGTNPEPAAPAARSSSSSDELGWYGPRRTVQISPKTYARLCEQYGQPAVDDRIVNMENWMRQNGQRYRNNADTLEQWLRNDTLPSGDVLPAPSQAPPAQPAPAYTGKRTGAHSFAQRTYSDEELDGLLYTDLDKLNE